VMTITVVPGVTTTQNVVDAFTTGKYSHLFDAVLAGGSDTINTIDTVGNAVLYEQLSVLGTPAALTSTVVAGNFLYFTDAGNKLYAIPLAGDPSNLASLSLGVTVDPTQLVSLAGKLYFLEERGTTTFLRSADGTTLSTGVDLEINFADPATFVNLTAIDSDLYFNADIDSPTNIGVELWRFQTSGALNDVADIDLVGDLYPAANNSNAQDFVKFGNSVYFSAEDDVVARTLFKLNPAASTLAPTVVSGGDLVTTTNSSNLVGFSGNLLYTDFNGTSYELFIVDASGSEKVSFTGTSDLENLTAVGSRLYFTTANTATESLLCR
jgi:hypothetical protein